ncbi:MAG: ABC-type transport auxiliary lipoprotein family protein, partial [Caulobacteraceae bacterium]|nr:ABC-type transport auxiliary lipoprotein family protein [Caulobacteraceae bacterium]
YRQAEDVLRIDVRRFEAVYDRGEKAAPKVVVRVRATLVSREDRSLVGERIFETESRASANRVSSIVEAFDAASAEVLTDLVDWTNRRGGAAS